MKKVQRIGTGIHLTHGDQDHNSVDKGVKSILRNN